MHPFKMVQCKTAVAIDINAYVVADLATSLSRSCQNSHEHGPEDVTILHYVTDTSSSIVFPPF